MIINIYNLSINSFSTSISKIINTQDKLKQVISCIACGILLVGTTYWICSRFWSSRRVKHEPSSPISMHSPQSKEKKEEIPKIKKPDLKKQVQFEDDVNPQAEKKVDKSIGTKQIDRDVQIENEERNNHFKNDLLGNEEPILDKHIDQIDSKQSPSNPIAAQVSICITSSMETGFVGNSPDLIPHIHQFKLEDKNPLTLKEDDVLLSLHCFNLPQGVQIPDNLYLPASLFEDKKEGDNLRLYYEDQLLEFQLHQNQHNLKFERGSFEEIVQRTKLNCGDNEHPLFEQFDPYDLYQLPDRTVYKPIFSQSDQYQLQAVSNDQFRPLQKTAVILDEGKTKTINILKSLPMDMIECKEGFYLPADLPAFSEEDFEKNMELVLNKEIFAIHVFREATELEANFKDEKPIFIPRNPIEFLKGYKWRKIFKDLTLEQMQVKIASARLTIQNGMLLIFFPADN